MWILPLGPSNCFHRGNFFVVVQVCAPWPACVGEGLERLHKGGEAEGEQEDEGQNAAHHVDTVPAESVLEAGVLAQLHAVVRYFSIITAVSNLMSYWII